jgi:cation diffusion facilitator CzcD-associated flavoprotein CzcO
MPVTGSEYNHDQHSFCLDVVVVGAGVAGLYLIHKLRGAGFNVKAVDSASGVGGTWYWNRYPGARCDVDSMFYSYGCDEGLEQEWEWTERYPAQQEILSYLNHVADRFDLRKDILFETKIASAHFDEEGSCWRLTTEDGRPISASYCIMATGCLSTVNHPNFQGLDEFRGRVFHTGHWPHEPVDFSDRHVGVVGTGSSGVQAIQEIAKEAAYLTIFQRTPSYVVEAFNRPLDAAEQAEIKANYQGYRAAARETFGGFSFAVNDQSALAVTEEECQERLEEAWQTGGTAFLAAFNDLGTNEAANMRAQDFVRAKIREKVHNPEVAEKLTPHHTIGCKRLCLGTNYYETYNRPNVNLIQLEENGVERITARGLVTGSEEYQFDDLVLATGFDAMTGALSRIDIQGRNGTTLKLAWEAGPRNYLGLMTNGFPNLFTVTGPGSPSVLSNMMPTIEQHVEWIADCLVYLREDGSTEIEAELAAQDFWVDHVNDLARQTLRYNCNSWYLGANVPGKPRIFMPYIGGMPAYRAKCEEVARAGYDGFRIT